MDSPDPDRILAMLRRRAEGVPPKTIAHQLGISRATVYRWLSRYEGLEESQIRRLQRLSMEERALRRAISRFERSVDLLREARALGRGRAAHARLPAAQGPVATAGSGTSSGRGRRTRRPRSG